MPRDILYTKHAKEMMELRKISKELVNEALTNPDEVLDQDGKKINHKIIGDKKTESHPQGEWKFLYSYNDIPYP